ncbi:lantibiotic dehydratase C-terminal domain-containing protein [Arthrobacter sp. H20]|uniref:lantibiotic dehydratase C-terminal domain-containing protein n=1 Tax=Arthrobacter sp. H20 TaxID=1267981 RepID=UPI0004792B6E|nr:lantibiotic dehydratase C-terminal domain-containing protein [Arthrobacter sp. H20]
MSQLTAVRNASRTASSTQWWHLSIFTGGFDVADGIIEDLVTPLAAQAQLLGTGRWFFTRCEEPAVAQVRLHVLASPAAVARLQAFFTVLRGEGPSGELNGSRSGADARLRVKHELSVPANNQAPLSLDSEIGRRLETDLVKYGGVEGLDLAEEVFEISSELAVWASRRFPKMHNRSAFGALLLFDSARSMMKGPRSAVWPDRRRVSWDFYWDSHLRTCTAELGPRAGGVREALIAQVDARTPAFHGLMAATAAESAAQSWRRRWSRAIDNYLYRADKARVSRSAQHLTVYQAHMTLNRIGFTAREEAVLGLYARSWSIEREASSYQQN